jgi:cell division protein FtsW (lipid II flippase)
MGVKRPGHEADHSPPSSAEVKEWVELFLHSPNTPSWRGAKLKKHRDRFTLLLLLSTVPLILCVVCPVVGMSIVYFLLVIFLHVTEMSATRLRFHVATFHFSLQNYFRVP